MIKQIKKMSLDYLHRYGNEKLTPNMVIKGLESQGYTVVKFNNVENSEEVSVLISLLGVGNYIASSKGFTYADNHNRIVFVHEDLSEDEMVYVLLHEQGHILCRHLQEGNIFGNDVTQEYEANEFAHYVMNPGIGYRIIKHKIPIIAAICIILVAVIIILVVGAIKKEQSYYGDYYITASGHKYHEADCIFVKNKTNVRRLTQEEFESGEYEACEICLPD